MASNSKHTDWILETIDHLRRRKARPDLERICHVVRRRFGLSAAETEAKLEKLVDAEIVIKVDYKGSTSYRNAAKWRKSMLGCAVLNSTTISIKIIEAILDLAKMKVIAAKEADNENGENQPSPSQNITKEDISKYATKTGVSLEDINKWLQDNCDGFDNLKSPLIVVLKREIDAGRVKRLMTANYVITSAQMEEIGDDVVRPLKTNRKSESKPGTPPVESQNETSDLRTAESNSPESKTFTRPSPDQRVTTSAVAGQGVPQPARRGRPPKHRPAVASLPSPSAASSSAPSLSPTSSSQSKLKRILTNDSDSQPNEGPHRKAPKKKENKRTPSGEHVCDFCELTSLSNSKGEPEILLHCKDCTARAHPSCMKYSSLLASRACRGPWQCMDCKTCCVCQDPGEPDQMLFCDGCDKGYHMSCHQPPITKKPSGSWECSECRLENMKLQRNEFMASIGDRHTLSHDSAPPTPAESPVPSHLVNGDIDIPTSPKYLGQDRFPDASGWSVDNVVDYFTSAGFEEQAKAFSEQEIDGVALLLLKRSDVLKGLGLKLGPALKINRLVQGLQTAKQQIL